MSSMVWQFVVFLSLIACGGTYANNNTRCFECQDVPLPAYCSYVMECAPGQICMVEKFITSGGIVLYNSGCQSTTRCEQRARSVVDDVTFYKRSDILVCQECCSSEFCNNEGCGSLAIARDQRGPHCFHCYYQDAPDLCRTVTTCDKGEVCMLTEIQATDGQGGSPVYKSSCMNAAVCKTGGAILIGKKRFTGCHTCCSDDFCNDQCDHVTVPTQPMTSLTTEPTTPSQTTNPTTTTEPTTTTTPTSTTEPTTTTPTTTTIQTTTESSKDYCNRHYYYLYDGPSHLCYQLHNKPRTWDDANHQCKGEGAMLAVVDTQEKWNFLKVAISHHYHHGNVYIGGRDNRHPDNNFHWTNGARVTFHAWSHGQPDGGNEDCIYVSEKDGHWHDTACNNQMAYVCTRQLP